MDGLLSSVMACVVAIVIDLWLDKPRRGHPLVLFGRWADRAERWLNSPPGQGIGHGALAVLVLVGPPVILGWLMVLWLPGILLWVAEVMVLWLALSLRSLVEHARAVEYPLRAGDLIAARVRVGRIVSRKTDTLDECGVASAATESVLENGADAVFASLFWFLVAGLPGVVLYRAVSTLDTLWGYRNERFLTFGRVAARLDDLLNWVPARLTAMTYALAGQTTTAWRCWRTQARHWDNPNAGPALAAGAGALAVSLGGPALYATGVKLRPVLGLGPAATSFTIDQAIRLIRRGVWLWLAVLTVLALLSSL